MKTWKVFIGMFSLFIFLSASVLADCQSECNKNGYKKGECSFFCFEKDLGRNGCPTWLDLGIFSLGFTCCCREKVETAITVPTTTTVPPTPEEKISPTVEKPCKLKLFNVIPPKTVLKDAYAMIIGEVVNDCGHMFYAIFKCTLRDPWGFGVELSTGCDPIDTSSPTWYLRAQKALAKVGTWKVESCELYSYTGGLCWLEEPLVDSRTVNTEFEVFEGVVAGVSYPPSEETTTNITTTTTISTTTTTTTTVPPTITTTQPVTDCNLKISNVFTPTSVLKGSNARITGEVENNCGHMFYAIFKCTMISPFFGARTDATSGCKPIDSSSTKWTLIADARVEDVGTWEIESCKLYSYLDGFCWEDSTLDSKTLNVKFEVYEQITTTTTQATTTTTTTVPPTITTTQPVTTTPPTITTTQPVTTTPPTITTTQPVTTTPPTTTVPPATTTTTIKPACSSPNTCRNRQTCGTSYGGCNNNYYCSVSSECCCKPAAITTTKPPTTTTTQPVILPTCSGTGCITPPSSGCRCGSTNCYSPNRCCSYTSTCSLPINICPSCTRTLMTSVLSDLWKSLVSIFSGS